MPIPKSYTKEKLLNRKCHPDREIRNGAGHCISPGTVCTIVGVVRGHGFTIKTEACPYCGQSAYISRVSRDELTLLPEDAGREGA